MAKKGVGRQSKRGAVAVSSDRGAVIAAAALAVVLAGVPLFVDSGADASFDGPKRLVALVGLALAAAAAFAWPPRGAFSALAFPFSKTSATGPAKAAGFAASLLLGSLGWALVAALASSRREAALDAWRAILLSALALPLGASRVVARRGRMLLAVFLGACAVDAAVSIAQSRGSFQPLQLSTPGLRDATGAFTGNVGYLATALALSAVAALGLLLFAKTLPVRAAAAGLLVLFAAGLAVNRNLTSLTAAGAGFTILIAWRFGKRALLPITMAIGILALTVAAYQPLRHRVVHAAAAAGTGDWDRLTTYRGGPWAAALEMARERPILGFGPGTFGAEYVPHRLAAEIRYRRRFVNPLVTSSYGETHCDYLQPFAEVGIPGALAALGAAAMLLVGAVRRARSAPEAERGEAAILLALLAAGAVAALTWFPLQRPISAVPLLLAAGRAWRVASGGPGRKDAALPAGRSLPDARPSATAGAEVMRGETHRTAPLPKADGRVLRAVAGVAIAAVLVAGVWPEIPRYAAERKLRAAQGAFRFVLTRTSEVTDPPAALARVREIALDAAAALPGDSRPLVLAGGTQLAAGHGERAIELYRSALAAGERAEIDLNLGRACDALARPEDAAAWFLRGGWVSPRLLATLLPDVSGPPSVEVARLETELRAGRLPAPPPLPR